MKNIITAPNLISFPHGFTTIHSPDDSNHFFNLKGPEDPKVISNRKLLESFYPGYKLSFIHQTHSIDCVYINKIGDKTQMADAQWTNQKKILLTTMVADCAPILVAFKDSSIVVAIHAGWRGALNGIVPNVLRHIQPHLKEDISKAIVAVGPHICEKNLEFQGPELKLWKEKFPEALSLVENKYFVNVSKKILHDFHQLNIQNIWVSPECTFQVEEKFFSHRRQKEMAGRQIGFIGLNG